MEKLKYERMGVFKVFGADFFQFQLICPVENAETTKKSIVFYLFNNI